MRRRGLSVRPQVRKLLRQESRDCPRFCYCWQLSGHRGHYWQRIWNGTNNTHLPVCVFVSTHSKNWHYKGIEGQTQTAARYRCWLYAHLLISTLRYTQPPSGQQWQQTHLNNSHSQQYGPMRRLLWKCSIGLIQCHVITLLHTHYTSIWSFLPMWGLLLCIWELLCLGIKCTGWRGRAGA